jgi:hypothetical protein
MHEGCFDKEEEDRQAFETAEQWRETPYPPASRSRTDNQRSGRMGKGNDDDGCAAGESVLQEFELEGSERALPSAGGIEEDMRFVKEFYVLIVIEG